MEKIPFVKMQGIGNDYVYIDCFERTVENPEQLSVEVSHRSYAIGSNGLVLICPSDTADAKMRIFNADGSEAVMCGNGVRCVGKYIFDKTGKSDLKIETLSGIKTLKVVPKNEKTAFVSVDMGRAEFLTEKIPMITEKEKFINCDFKAGNYIYNSTALSMGNPHIVVFEDDIDSIDLSEIGPYFEKNPVFPNGVNTEFANVISEHEIKMRVWERGSAETLACGTGACAVTAASCLNGLVPYEKEITVHLRGGDLFITCKKDFTVTMKGEAETVYFGEYLL